MYGQSSFFETSEVGIIDNAFLCYFKQKYIGTSCQPNKLEYKFKFVKDYTELKLMSLVTGSNSLSYLSNTKMPIMPTSGI